MKIPVRIGEDFEQEVVSALCALADVMRYQAYADDRDGAESTTYQERLYVSARVTRTQFSASLLTVQLMDRLAEPIRRTPSGGKKKHNLTALDGGKERSSK